MPDPLRLTDDHPHVVNFDTLQQAFANGDVALMVCLDERDQREVAVICAVSLDDDGETRILSPFAVMIDDNPYERYGPPNIDGGFHRATTEETRL